MVRDTPDIPIPPGLEAHVAGLDWQTVELAALPETTLSAGQVVTGFEAFADFNVLETRACDSVAASVFGDARAEGSVIMSNRISNLLKPEGFSARITGACALTFPFDLRRVSEYPKIGRVTQREDTEGLIVLYAADLMRGLSKSRRVGTLVQEVAYYRRQWAQAENRPEDSIRRVLGGRQSFDEASAAMKEIIDASAGRAARVARHALRYVYSTNRGGSLPPGK